MSENLGARETERDILEIWIDIGNTKEIDGDRTWD